MFLIAASLTFVYKLKIRIGNQEFYSKIYQLGITHESNFHNLSQNHEELWSQIRNLRLSNSSYIVLQKTLER